MAQPTLPDPPGSGALAPNEERNWAMAAHIGSLVAAVIAMGFLAPLGVLLYMGGRSDFVRRHAIESLNFQITLLLYFAVAMAFIFVTFTLGAFVILPVLGIAAIVVLIVILLATMAASRGEDYRYPLTFRFIK